MVFLICCVCDFLGSSSWNDWRGAWDAAEAKGGEEGDVGNGGGLIYMLCVFSSRLLGGGTGSDDWNWNDRVKLANENRLVDLFVGVVMVILFHETTQAKREKKKEKERERKKERNRVINK
jgi:hypothetical protein